MRDDGQHVEGKVKWVSAKARLVETTLYGDFWVPRGPRVTYSMTDADPDGNCQFEISNWWWTKMEDFRVQT
jgi:hypothetical protein